MTNNYSLKSKPILLAAKTARKLAKKIKGAGNVMQMDLSKKYPDIKGIVEGLIEGIEWIQEGK